MIVFTNPGLIDLDAVRTMGVNVKERPGAFGHFGTGLKFALATVLRGGGEVALLRGEERILFRTEERLIRGQPFRIVQMSVGPVIGTGGEMDEFVDLGFTDQLGKNWEPWMVLREFGCNALDEGGGMSHDTAPIDRLLGQEDTTTLLVQWDALEEVFEQRDTIFCTAGGYSQVLATEQVQVLEGRSDFLFYRGVRVYRLEHPSVFTYNILSQQMLTEDRTIASFHYPMGEIRRMWLECTDKEALLRVLAPEGECFERTINYMQAGREASREFLDTVLDARSDKSLKGQVVESASQLLHKHLRSTRNEGVGWASSRFMQDEFSSAMEAIGELFSEDELRLNDDLPLVLVEDDEIVDGGLTMLEEGRIYVGRSLLRRGRREIATALLPLILQVRLGDLVYTSEIAPMLTAVLLRQHPDLRPSDPRLRALDAMTVDDSCTTCGQPRCEHEGPEYDDECPRERTMSVADNLLVAMDVRGEEYPARPSEL